MSANTVYSLKSVSVQLFMLLYSFWWLFTNLCTHDKDKGCMCLAEKYLQINFQLTIGPSKVSVSKSLADLGPELGQKLRFVAA